MNRPGAIMILSIFAAIWWMFGAAQIGRDSLMLYAVGIVISGFIVALDRLRGGRSATHEERKHRGRVLRIASAVEGATILAAVIVLSKIGRRDLIAPAVAIIVGCIFCRLPAGFEGRSITSRPRYSWRSGCPARLFQISLPGSRRFAWAQPQYCGYPAE